MSEVEVPRLSEVVLGVCEVIMITAVWGHYAMSSSSFLPIIRKKKTRKRKMPQSCIFLGVEADTV